MNQDMFSRSDMDILLLHVVRDRNVFLDYVSKTDEPVFDPGLYVAHDFIDKVIREAYHFHKDYVSPSMLKLKLEEALAESRMDEELKKDVIGLFSFVEEIPAKDLQPEMANGVLRKVVDGQILTSANERIKRLLERGNFSSRRVIDDLSQERERRRIGITSEVRVLKPFSAIDKYLIEGEVFRTGIEFVDMLLNGGPWRHDLLGLLGPSGGGKTTFSIQLATSWVRQDEKRNAVILSYEQPIEGDISARLCSAITGVPVDEFRGKRFDQLPQPLRDKLVAMGKPVEDRFHFVDLSGGRSGTRGIEDIKAILEGIKVPETGPPTLVIIDWFLPCIQRSMVGAGIKMDNETLRLFGSRFMDDLKILKNNWNIIFLVTHQLNCEKAGASAARKPDWTDAAEWKGFAWFMDVCFAIGTLSEDDICWFCASKVRSMAANDRMVKLRGNLVKFVEADNEFMLARGKIVPKVKAMDDISVSGRREVDVSHLSGLDPTIGTQK